jgi:2-amino-4-hydroxy-6-hydroxymethyldihydropteridine diphosphokinase
MDYKDWESIYRRIVKDFHFSVENDEKAADVLNTLLRQKSLKSIDKLNDLIAGKEIIIFGAGPSLESSIIKHKKMFADTLKIAADGATTALLKYEILPDIIVTDLDGKVPDQVKANLYGSIVVIHAHGDNIDKIKKYVPKFKGEIVGTTQTNPEPYDNIHNLGGFTDGDRAVYLADHFHAKKICLVGFDFNNEIGPYSFSENKNKTLKLKKLKWCKNLINMLNKKNISYL